MESKSLAERLRHLLDKADVLGLVADDGQHEQAMCRGQAPVNRSIAATPQGFRAKLMEARAQLLLEQTGWNQVTYEKMMHLKMCGDHELYQGVRRRVNTRPNGMGLSSNASALRLAKGS